MISDIHKNTERTSGSEWFINCAHGKYIFLVRKKILFSTDPSKWLVAWQDQDPGPLQINTDHWVSWHPSGKRFTEDAQDTFFKANYAFRLQPQFQEPYVGSYKFSVSGHVLNTSNKLYLGLIILFYHFIPGSTKSCSFTESYLYWKEATINWPPFCKYLTACGWAGRMASTRYFSPKLTSPHSPRNHRF